MPHYDYVCETCEKQFEVFQSMNDKRLTKCPKKVAKARSAACWAPVPDWYSKDPVFTSPTTGAKTTKPAPAKTEPPPPPPVPASTPASTPAPAAKEAPKKSKPTKD